jgi:predicted nucleic acid-binding protein
MKPSIYIETTIPSYYTSRPSRDVVVAGHQATTRDWWDNRLSYFRIFISQIVLDEAADGDAEFARKRLDVLKPFALLDLRDDVTDLARHLIENGPIPQKAARDALHIALAAVHGMDFLLTWNCTHIANAEMSIKIVSICRDHGVECPVICTPEELMGA